MSNENNTGNTGDVKRDQTTLSAEQKAAVAGLAAENVYVSQSKWKTFRELPGDKKWWFFRQHFLIPVIAIVAAIVLIGSYAITVATRGPDPELTVTSVNLEDYSASMDKLKAGFVKAEKIDDERLIDLSDTLSIDESGSSMTDDSMKLVARMTAGQINAMVADRDGLDMLASRGDVANMAETLGKAKVRKLAEAGALCDQNGEPVDAKHLKQGVALSLDASPVWTGIEGMPKGVYLTIGNTVDDAAKQRVKQFVEYLGF